jgi:D-methionine transport system ATP-binding protein
MISLEDVSKKYPGQVVPALDGVSFAVEQGDICGIVGLSGAGKSTLIRCMTGLERVDRGAIHIGDVDITRLRGAQLRQAQRRLGVVFQHFNLLSHRTALGNVMFPLEIAKASPEEARRRAEELLDVVGLSDKRDAYPAKLSGGQQQRVGIARALAANPSVLLCDEPTSALDPITTQSILELIRQVNAEFQVTVLIVTHQLSITQQACDSIIVIDEGRIVETGPAQEVLHTPTSRILKAMVTTLSWS